MKHIAELLRIVLLAILLLMVWLSLAWQPLLRMGLETALHELGFTHARVGDVGGNPLRGQLWIRELRFDQHQYLEQVHLAVDVAAALKGRLAVHGIEINGGAVSLAFDRDALHWGHVTVPLQSEPNTPATAPALPFPFSLKRAVVKNLRVELKPGTTTQSVRIQNVRLAAIHLPFEDQPLKADWDLFWENSRISGEATVDVPAQHAQGFIGIQQLNAAQLEPWLKHYAPDAAELAFETLTQNWRFDATGLDPAHFKLWGSGSIQALKINKQQAGRVDIKGTLRGEYTDKKLSVNFAGTGSAHDLRTPEVLLGRATFNATALQVTRSGNTFNAHFKGATRLEGLAAMQADTRLHLNTLRGDGLDVQVKADPRSHVQLSLGGQLRAEALKIQTEATRLKVAEMAFSGGVPDFLRATVFAKGNKPPEIGLAGLSGQLKGVEATSVGQSLQVGSVALAEASYDKTGVQWQAIVVDRADARNGEDRVLVNALRVAAGDGDLSQRRLNVQKVAIDGALLHWEQPQTPDTKSSSQLNTPHPAASSGETSPVWGVSVGQFLLQQGVLDLHLRAPAPAAERLLVRRLQLNDFSTVSSRSATFSMDAVRPPFGKITSAGSLQWLPQHALDATLQARDLDLTAWTPWIRQVLEVGLNSGTLNVDAKGQLRGSRLNVDTQLTLYGVEFDDTTAANSSKPANPLASSQTAGEALALQQALKLLEEDDGIIRLRLPISGDLDDPQFHFMDVFRILFKKAVQQAAVTGLSQLLQPYATYLTVGKFLYEQITAIRLAPIEFVPGSTRMKTPSAYLDKIATLVKKRPKLVVKLCAQAARADQQALQKAGQLPKGAAGDKVSATLISLVRQRQVQVKRAILQRAGNIDSARLVLCRPLARLSEQPPRIELLVE
ncbi:DUF748 domain-containing protein [Sulfurivirga caldicuralii]|uniref:DUF748 domain-containing protein n=1 Tax=Sulfurivirga caldicuralii TaxID=364032 RepID=UPI0013562F37|nr:DUF748 domain-containing protein [Sulfurivirga caldicuralii]